MIKLQISHLLERSRLAMMLLTTLYIFRVVPALADFGRSRWQERLAAGEPPQPGGPFAEALAQIHQVLGRSITEETYIK